ncbi:MAG: AAA family ATPase [Bacteroidales bacterium]|nr:AAA family ATPase [Bacteroidales bacterium]
MTDLEIPGKSIVEFQLTKEYSRFKEFADSVVEYRYIGICHGEAGVGKSLAASYYTKWDEKIGQEKIVDGITDEMRKKINLCKGLMITAPVVNTPKIINRYIHHNLSGFGYAYTKCKGEEDYLKIIQDSDKHCPLVIVDEADRLNINSLEEIRNMYDQTQFGLIFIGMPGIEKRFSRYPQLYSRLGFSHEFKNLSEDEMRFLFPKIWKTIEIVYNPEHYPDVEAMNAILRITAGNFRLIDRLFSQIKRILKINKLDRISKEVVDAARKCLVIGDPE